MESLCWWGLGGGACSNTNVDGSTWCSAIGRCGVSSVIGGRFPWHGEGGLPVQCCVEHCDHLFLLWGVGRRLGSIHCGNRWCGGDGMDDESVLPSVAKYTTEGGWPHSTEEAAIVWLGGRYQWGLRGWRLWWGCVLVREVMSGVWRLWWLWSCVEARVCQWEEEAESWHEEACVLWLRDQMRMSCNEMWCLVYSMKACAEAEAWDVWRGSGGSRGYWDDPYEKWESVRADSRSWLRGWRLRTAKATYLPGWPLAFYHQPTWRKRAGYNTYQLPVTNELAPEAEEKYGRRSEGREAGGTGGRSDATCGCENTCGWACLWRACLYEKCWLAKRLNVNAYWNETILWREILSDMRDINREVKWKPASIEKWLSLWGQRRK